ncbi:hypothetical protein EMIT0P74_20255 [Pseudomonas sp. IT-P74]
MGRRSGQTGEGLQPGRHALDLQAAQGSGGQALIQKSPHSPCRSEPARDEPENTEGCQVPSVIVDDHREQARSYSHLCEIYDQITRAPPANDAFVWHAGLSSIGSSPVSTTGIDPDRGPP